MAKKNGGMIHTDVYNETGSGDGDKPDVSGDKLYYSYDEVMANHLKETGEMFETPNSKASRDMYGGPAKGEANPAGMGGKGGGKGE